MNVLPWYLRAFILLFTIIVAIPFAVRGEYLEALVTIIVGWAMAYFYPLNKDGGIGGRVR